jgi:hypothetical protein
MTTQRELDNLLDAFFEDGPVRVTDRVIDGALAQIDKNERRRTFHAPRRLQAMNIFSRLATAAVIGVLVVGALAYFARPEAPLVGATATPGLPTGSGDPAVVGPSPTNSVAATTPAPTGSARPTPPSVVTALIAYTRPTDKPRRATSFTCRFVDGPTCPVNRVWLVGVDGTGAHELFPEGSGSQELLGWSPDGTHVLYREDGESYMTDVQGSEPQLLAAGCAEQCLGYEAVALSSDGTALLFVRHSVEGNADVARIAILSLASGQVVELNSTAPKGGSLPGWSPDGQHIVFTRFGREETDGPFQPFNSAIFVVDADGQNLRQISPATLDAEYARWSPDGSRIVFTSPNGDGADIYTMRADGSDVQRLTSDGVSMNASWTRDGRILFIRNDGGADALVGFWTMDGDGRNAAELVPGTVTGARGFDPELFWPATVPLWQPTGGPAIVPPPWHASAATVVGPPAPTPVATPMPELAAGFSRTGSLQTLQSDGGVETATLLQDGRVLVTRSCTAAAEIYDPQTGTFSPTGAMAAARRFETATLLQDGRVLIAGGRDDCSGQDRIFTSAEIYDPQTGTFSPTGSMGVARQFHAAALLADGRVLIAGGITDVVTSTGSGIVLAATSSNVLKSAEIYDPQTGTFSGTGSMSNFRDRFTATTLNDGRVLVLGGGGEGYAARTAAELYDPASGTFSRTGSMSRARWLHTATLLSDGRVLIAGGRQPNDRTLASAEVYDPGSGEFSTVGPMATARQQHTATVLQDGRVLVTGGYTYDGNTWDVLSSTEIFDPGSTEFNSTGSMGEARWSAVAALLNDGRVLIAGGTGVGTEDLVQLTSAILYQP